MLPVSFTPLHIIVSPLIITRKVRNSWVIHHFPTFQWIGSESLASVSQRENRANQNEMQEDVWWDFQGSINISSHSMVCWSEAWSCRHEGRQHIDKGDLWKRAGARGGEKLTPRTSSHPARSTIPSAPSLPVAWARHFSILLQFWVGFSVAP